MPEFDYDLNFDDFDGADFVEYYEEFHALDVDEDEEV